MVSIVVSSDGIILRVRMYRNYVRKREGESALTHVTSKETKKRSATLVYPNAALFASLTAL